MLKIKTPEEYYCERNLISRVGEIVRRYGNKAFIIAGEKAFTSVEDNLIASLQKYYIKYETSFLKGYPTYEKVVDNTSLAYQYNADFIIGIGGGKVCDVSKAVANMRNIPVVMIPTVAATCACWAARSILYTEEGDFDRALWNKNNPNMILADVDVLEKSPRRYLAAGILDTLAKWYEFRPLIASSPDDVVLLQDVAIAKLAYDILVKYGEKAYRGEIEDNELKQVYDAIFFLAGASGSFANGKAYRGFAHSYYYATTHIPESRHRLHGEKVAFGLLIQFVLRENEEFIKCFIDILKSYDLTDTLFDWQLSDIDKAINKISESILVEAPSMIEKNFVSDKYECNKAVKKASQLLRE